MKICAVDPGSSQSAFVVWQGSQAGFVVDYGILANADILAYIAASPWEAYVFEQIASYGMPVGAEVFATCVWTGRFYQQAVTAHVPQIAMMPRREVKLHLCGSPRANDATIRQALIDRFGGKDKAIGKKAAPGPCYGLARDLWQALGLAVTWHDVHAKTEAA